MVYKLTNIQRNYAKKILLNVSQGRGIVVALEMYVFL